MAVNRSKRRAPLLDDYHLLSYEDCDSTNEEAKRLAIGGGAHGAFIWSLRQSDGKGRKGRNWISHQGNLFTSVLLQPGCNSDRMGQLSFVTAVAAHISISPLLVADDCNLQFKWPNDLMLNGKKLGGILLESIETTSEEDGTRQRWVIAGLGMNIESCPDDLDVPATYLKEAGLELISAKIVLSRFIHHFIEWYGMWQQDGFKPICDYWMQHCAHHGKQVTVKIGDESVTGQFIKLDGRGNLVLDCDGAERSVAAGEVLL